MAEHWYKSDGQPLFEVEMSSKPGKMRPTTLRDARKLHLLPSVTTIMQELHKPMLDQWKQEQITSYAYDNPPPAEVDYEEWHKDIIRGAFEQVKDAADAGTAIHNGMELALAGFEYDEHQEVYLPELKATSEMRVFVEPAIAWIKEHNLVPTAYELRLASTRYGFAGTTDVAFETPVYGLRGILDYKTRKTKPGKPCVAYDENVMQIAAYHMAHYGHIDEGDFGVNVYISSTEPGRVEGVIHDANKLRAAWDAFLATCTIWRWRKGYDPRTTV